MERTLTRHEVARLLGVNIKTIQRWNREDRLKPAGRTATGRRYHTEDQILAFRHQRPDLKNQRLALEQFCTARGLAHVESP